MTMKVTVLYFARLREAIGVEREELELPSDVRDAGSLREWLRGRSEVYRKALSPNSQIRVAVDQRIAEETTPIRDGAEIAFFPPVTGGKG
jgi:molybdopterin synthase sulfur carrier subunit